MLTGGRLKRKPSSIKKKKKSSSPKKSTSKTSKKSIKKRTLTWGFGLEHEIHLLHIPTPIDVGHKEFVITQLETNTRRGGNDPIKYFLLSDTLPILNRILGNDATKASMKSSERKLLETMRKAYEFSGRKCGGEWVLRRIKDIKMPEFVTTAPFSTPENKKILSDYYMELINMERDFIYILMKYDKPFRTLNETYGRVSNFVTGMTSHIKVAKDYTKTKLEIEPHRHLDYTGSYHVTMTLPFNEKTSETKFINNHKNFANQVQWLEPLFLTAFFSCDDRAMGTRTKLVRGSYRVMMVGWGNFAGSDVRKLDTGIGRYTNLPSTWRTDRKLNEFEGIEKVNICNKYHMPGTPDEPKSVSMMSSDIRTFGSTDPRRPQHRTSGAGMNKPNGIEIRIFDNFDTNYLGELCKVLIYIAENSRVHITKEYVYNNRSWRQAMSIIMRDGWRAELPISYIKELRKQLNLKIRLITDKSRMAYYVFTTIMNEMYDKHSNGLWTRLMIGDKQNTRIRLPSVNYDSWNIGFMMMCNNDYSMYLRFIKFALTLNVYARAKRRLLISYAEYTELFYKYFPKKFWSKNVMDMLAFMDGLYHRPCMIVWNNDKVEAIEIDNNVEKYDGTHDQTWWQFTQSTKRNFNTELILVFNRTVTSSSSIIYEQLTAYFIKNLKDSDTQIITFSKFVDIFKYSLKSFMEKTRALKDYIDVKEHDFVTDDLFSKPMRVAKALFSELIKQGTIVKHKGNTYIILKHRLQDVGETNVDIDDFE